MAGNGSSRRWLIILLVAAAVVFAAAWPWGSVEDIERETGQVAPSAAAPELPSPVTGEPITSENATRRVKGGCDPEREAAKYEPLVGKKALVTLSWDGLSKQAADLEIPAQVVSVDGGSIHVRFLQIPMRDQYLNIWQQSGHIQAGPDGIFLVDPCSASVAAWPEMQR